MWFLVVLSATQRCHDVISCDFRVIKHLWHRWMIGSNTFAVLWATMTDFINFPHSLNQHGTKVNQRVFSGPVLWAWVKVSELSCIVRAGMCEHRGLITFCVCDKERAIPSLKADVLQKCVIDRSLSHAHTFVHTHKFLLAQWELSSW